MKRRKNSPPTGDPTDKPDLDAIDESNPILKLLAATIVDQIYDAAEQHSRHKDHANLRDSEDVTDVH